MIPQQFDVTTHDALTGHRRIVARNTALQLVARLMELGSMLVLTIAVGRLWGSGELGRFAAVTTLATTTFVLADWGLGLLLIREVSHRGSKEVIGVALPLVIVLSAVATVVMVGLARVLAYPPELWRSVLLAGVWMGLAGPMLVLRSACYALERMEFDAIAVVVERSIVVILGLAVVLGHGTVEMLIGALVAGRVANLMVGWAVYRRYIGGINIGTNWRAGLSLLWHAMPFGLNMLATAIYVQSGILVIAYARSMEEVGLYRAAASLIVPVGTLGVALSYAQMPRLVQAFSRNDGHLLAALHRASIRYALITGVPMGLLLLMLPQALVRALYGDGFSLAARAAQILAPVIPIRFLTGTLATLLTAMNRQGLRTWSVGVGAVANVAMNLIAVPRYGVIGACVTTLATDLCILALLLFHVRRIISSLRLQATPSSSVDTPVSVPMIPGSGG